MEEKRNFSVFIMKTLSVLLCLTLFSMWMLTNMYARYTTETSSEDSARVAAYVFELSDSENSKILDLNNIKKPGDSQTYSFTVTNKKGTVISEVAQSYTMKTEIDGSLPLNCSITAQEKDDKDSAGKNFVCSLDCATGNTGSATSEEIHLSPSQEYVKDYVLTVTWPAEYKDEKYASASGTSVVTLTVDAQQQD